jgi:hypothetical protein
MLRHSLSVYRDDALDGDPSEGQPIRFDDDRWRGFVPIRLPGTVSVQKRLPAGAAAVLINQAHTYTDLYLAIDAREKRWYDAINGKRTIDEIVRSTTTSDNRQHARVFFERLWWYDQVVFDASKGSSRVCNTQILPAD